GGIPFDNPTSVAIDMNGDILVSEQDGRRIQKVDTDGRWLATFDASTTKNGTEIWPVDLVGTE
ncbi:MAG: hypothetical protein GWN18_03470, partial [Thermoplasmata archaeon]|nr:hypothetical protein [Thermoplasmata archaeon]NIT76069.1 hypothetical protein [Thermoplasmata archaeon]NIU48168.1 hypothetical protein [Thermoplasmata archaeon]NIV77802.1 hypothetical protein [Thermoplasmata archaeon]NIW81644.1 hypothetical protein [Thermoplasmata archaeon]